MQTANRWLSWAPENEHTLSETGANSAKGANQIVSGMVGTVGTCFLAPLLVQKPSKPLQEPAIWEDDFSRWALAECLFKDGCLWRLEALHLHFCEWCQGRDAVGCMADTFAALLDLESLTVTAGLVYGLVLREEYVSLTEPERKAKSVPRYIGVRR